MRSLWALLLVLAAGACGGTSGDVITGVDAGGSQLFPPQPVDCTGGPNFTDCPCQAGATVACYTGPASTRGVGGCKDGTQTCSALVGEGGGFAFGACEGETVPTAADPCTGALPSDAGTSGDGAYTPCTSMADCNPNGGGQVGSLRVCAYLESAGCSAQGQCVPMSGVEGCQGGGPQVCTCSGQTENLYGLSCGIVPPGYVSTPIVSPTSGACADATSSTSTCSSNSDCSGNDECAFLLTEACEATGTCVARPALSNCMPTPLTGCSCAGTTVSWTTGTSCAAEELPGYAPEPIATMGACAGDAGVVCTGPGSPIPVVTCTGSVDNNPACTPYLATCVGGYCSCGP